MSSPETLLASQEQYLSTDPTASIPEGQLMPYIHEAIWQSLHLYNFLLNQIDHDRLTGEISAGRTAEDGGSIPSHGANKLLRNEIKCQQTDN